MYVEKILKLNVRKKFVELLARHTVNPGISKNECDSHFAIHIELFKNICEKYGKVVFACYIENMFRSGCSARSIILRQKCLRTQEICACMSSTCLH